MTNFRKHLEAYPTEGTKEYQLNQLMNILALIARAKDIMQYRIEDCRNIYGMEGDNIRCMPEDVAYIERYKAIINRLKGYYNNKVRAVKVFKV